jgi:hypothetical protein
VRAASRGDPIEGELPRPRSLASGTEPHLANPRVSRPRANPYRTGHGRPLELPDNNSMRNLQSATRSMGVAETSPSVPRRDDGECTKTCRRARPNRLALTQARGLDARLHPLGSTECRWRQTCAFVASRLTGTLPMPVEINAPHAGGGGLAKKPLKEHSRSCRASGARPAGPLERPLGTTLATRMEECPISKRQHLRDPNGNTRRCSGATVEGSPEGPLK